MNSYFASVEQAHRPYLRHLPLIVTADPYGNPKGKRSVTAAASYEAKALGIKSGMPLFEALALCPNAILVKGNVHKYETISLEILKIFEKYTDLVEPYSIDEAFLDVSETSSRFGGAEKIAILIKKEIQKRFGITCSIGIGPNKLIAKMASNMQKPNGLTLLKAKDLPQCLWHLSVKEIPGIGERRERRLRILGIRTIGDLANYPLANLRRTFGITGEYLYNAAWGLDDSPVNPNLINSLPKSLSHASTLKENTSDKELIRSTLFYLTDEITQKLRNSCLLTQVISVGVRYSDLTYQFAQSRLSSPTDNFNFIFKKAWSIINSFFPLKLPVRLIGIVESSLTPKKNSQLSLFPSEYSQEKVEKAIDSIRNRFGMESILRASSLWGRASLEG